MHQRAISNSDIVRQSGGYGASRRLSPSLDSNTSQPPRRRSRSRTRASVPASDGLVISRTVQATPTLSVKSRELFIAIRLETARRANRGARQNMSTALKPASAACHGAYVARVPARSYWYWIYNGRGLRRSTSDGV